jgi:hypothetical protein
VHQYFASLLTREGREKSLETTKQHNTVPIPAPSRALDEPPKGREKEREKKEIIEEILQLIKKDSSPRL